MNETQTMGSLLLMSNKLPGQALRSVTKSC